MARENGGTASYSQDVTVHAAPGPSASPLETPTSAARAVADIRSLMHRLSPSEARVARVVLADPARVVYRTAASIGEEADTSATLSLIHI